jgi:hypothetical protein
MLAAVLIAAVACFLLGASAQQLNMHQINAVDLLFLSPAGGSALRADSKFDVVLQVRTRYNYLHTPCHAA